MRGYFGGIILRGEGHTLPSAARLSLIRSETPLPKMLASTEIPLSGVVENFLNGTGISESVQLSDNFHYSCELWWLEDSFARFAFDLLAMLRGTYQLDRASSWYGLGWTMGRPTQDGDGVQISPNNQPST